MKQTVTSKYEPKSKNVTWIDMSTGRPVLKNFINGMWRPTGGGSTNPGYNVTKQTVTLFNDTIETSEQGGMYQGLVINIDFDLIAGENYTVVFDGTSYDVEATTFTSQVGGGYVVLGEFIIDDEHGEPSFETYPFNIMRGDQGGIKGMMLYTNTEGSHTVIIKHEEETMTTTPEFKSAIDSVTGYSIDKGNETLYDGTVETEDDGGYISGIITPAVTLVLGDTYKVTFNGTEYTCKCFDNDGDLVIGAPSKGLDWSTYPFNIVTFAKGFDYITMLATNQEGSCTVKIEHLSVSTKTTPEFVSMIQGIATDSESGCQIIYPDDIVWSSSLCSIYNNPPEQGKIYFIPFKDDNGRYLYPVHIDELINNDSIFSGNVTIIGNPIIVYNGTLTALGFGGRINAGSMSGLQITYNDINDEYRLSYKAGSPIG